MEPQARTLSSSQSQRIRRSISPLTVFSENSQSAIQCNSGGHFYRVVFKRHQRVKEITEASKLLNLGQGKVMVRNQAGLPLLEAKEQMVERILRLQSNPDRYSV